MGSHRCDGFDPQDVDDVRHEHLLRHFCRVHERHGHRPRCHLLFRIRLWWLPPIPHSSHRCDGFDPQYPQTGSCSSKPYFMIVGPACFALIGLLPLLSGYDGWLGGKGLLVLYVLQGVGRGVWEATNKACFLSYFGHVKDKGVIGSNIIIQNGGASAIAFFMNAYSDASPKLSDCQAAGNCPVYAQEAWAVLVFSLLAIVGFLGASVLHSKDVHTWSGALGVAKNEEESNELSTQFK